ncbi:MAG: hypothetical protein JWN67_1414 [Actinomycetia bacterium]|nr:hypothetical protein [Actinomycetes bacterium]
MSTNVGTSPPLAADLRPGDVLVPGQSTAEPTALLEALLPALDRLEGIRMLCGMSMSDVFQRVPDHVAMATHAGGIGGNAPLVMSGRMEVLACHMSELAWMVTDGPWRPDVALVLVSPPDADGMCSMGAGCDYLWHAVSAARVVLAEINENVPRIAGDTGVPLDRLDGWVCSDRPLAEYPLAEPTSLELEIAATVAGYVPDGACLQLGIGRLAEAVMRAVAGRRDLGIHSGMVGDTLLEMVREGIVTNARKPIDTGLSVAGSLLGTARCHALAAADPTLRLRSVGYLQDPTTLAAVDDLIAVNSALEVDLFGQVNAEVAGGRYLGSIGGQVDFLRGAARSRGGRSFIALPATASRGTASRIVPTVHPVTTPRSDVDVVVTEFGAAELRGITVSERARRLVEIAAPQFRDELRAAARSMGV